MRAIALGLALVTTTTGCAALAPMTGAGLGGLLGAGGTGLLDKLRGGDGDEVSPAALAGSLLDVATQLPAADVRAAVRWLREEIAAGRIAPADPRLAELQACFNAVVGLEDLAERLKAPAPEGEFRGLLYAGTQRVFGRDPLTEGRRLVGAIRSSCRELLPGGKLAGLARVLLP